MRITGGRARGIPLSLGGAHELRPATDRMRASVFSSLGALVDEARVLDLFAGTGAYGLEAISRGAAHATFVERNGKACAALRANLGAVAKSLGGRPPNALGALAAADVMSWKAAPGSSFDLIFADPPYADIARASRRFWELATEFLAPTESARLCLEMPGDFMPVVPPGWTLVRRLGKGRNQPTVGLWARAEA